MRRALVSVLLAGAAFGGLVTPASAEPVCHEYSSNEVCYQVVECDRQCRPAPYSDVQLCPPCLLPSLPSVG